MMEMNKMTDRANKVMKQVNEALKAAAGVRL
jgi:hypothetical protein